MNRQYKKNNLNLNKKTLKKNAFNTETPPPPGGRGARFRTDKMSTVSEEGKKAGEKVEWYLCHEYTPHPGSHRYSEPRKKSGYVIEGLLFDHINDHRNF